MPEPISRIQSELGYQPKVDLADGVEELLAWLRSQSADDRIDQATRELKEPWKRRCERRSNNRARPCALAWRRRTRPSTTLLLPTDQG